MSWLVQMLLLLLGRLLLLRGALNVKITRAVILEAPKKENLSLISRVAWLNYSWKL